MTRYASVLRMPAENLARYSELHAAVWPGVLATITECNIRNYSIYHRGGWLFSYFEYVGEDYEADMARMAADPTTRDWWAINRATPGAARGPRPGRVVGVDGGALPPGLTSAAATMGCGAAGASPVAPWGAGGLSADTAAVASGPGLRRRAGQVDRSGLTGRTPASPIRTPGLTSAISLPPPDLLSISCTRSRSG